MNDVALAVVRHRCFHFGPEAVDPDERTVSKAPSWRIESLSRVHPRHPGVLRRFPATAILDRGRSSPPATETNPNANRRLVTPPSRTCIHSIRQIALMKPQPQSQHENTLAMALV